MLIRAPRREAWLQRQRGFIEFIRASFDPATDPYWANVKLLALMENGADASTTFTDLSSSPKTLTANGNYQWDTAQAPTGLTSSGLGDGTGDWLGVANDAGFTPGLNEDFTVEWFTYSSSLPGGTVSWGWWKRNSGSGYSPIACNVTAAGATQLYMSSTGSSWNIASAVNFGTMTTGAWQHWAINRTGTAIRAYRNGTGVAVATSGAALYSHTDGPTIGGTTAGGVFPGWTAACRYTAGVGRYPANFTVPGLPFPTM